MFELSEFYTYCKNNDIPVIPFEGMPSEGATIRDDSALGIFLDFSKLTTTRQLRGVCMHEQGHAATGALHSVSSPYETVERAEHRVHRWSAETYLTAENFADAFSAGYTEPWQLSEWFDLPERDVLTAYRYWTENRGLQFDGPGEI